MAETTVDIDALDEENAPSSYTTETEESAPGRGQSITAPGSGLGRRKEAVARVRLVPGTGQWTLNGRSLEDYFPNKLHQQLVRAPFTILDLEGRFDVVAGRLTAPEDLLLLDAGACARLTAQLRRDVI